MAGSLMICNLAGNQSYPSYLIHNSPSNERRVDQGSSHHAFRLTESNFVRRLDKQQGEYHAY